MNTEANKEKSSLNSIGERLRRAREQMCLTQQNVAERLCLKLSTIRNIEEDKSPTDLASTFLRGYIRSYARLVNVPEEELLLMMSKHAPVKTAKVAPIQSFSIGKYRKKRDSWLMIFTWLVLSVVVGLTGAWWWQNHKAAQEDLASMASQQNMLTTKGESDIDKSISINVGISHSLSDNNNQSDIYSPVVVVPPSTPSTSGKSRLGLPENSNVSQSASDPHTVLISFTSDCWLEVTDATKKKLFSGIQHIGSKLSLAGITPYHLKIGAPAAVKIEYQGKTVDLSRFIRSNQVAHLTLDT